MTLPSQTSKTLPLALSMGDPCGVGPEIIVRALSLGVSVPCVVIGDVAVMRRAVAHCGLVMPVVHLNAPADALDWPVGTLAVWMPPALIDRPFDALASLPMGRIDARAGFAATSCIEARIM